MPTSAIVTADAAQAARMVADGWDAVLIAPEGHTEVAADIPWGDGGVAPGEARGVRPGRLAVFVGDPHQAAVVAAAEEMARELFARDT